MEIIGPPFQKHYDYDYEYYLRESKKKQNQRILVSFIYNN